MKPLVASLLLLVANFAHCEEALSVPTAYHARDQFVSVRAMESIILVVDVERTAGRFEKGGPIWKMESPESGAIIAILRTPMHGVMTSECNNWHQVCAKYTAPAIPGRHIVLVWDDHNPSVSARVEIEVTP